MCIRDYIPIGENIMAITIVKTLTDQDASATFADQAAWEAAHGACGGGHPSVQSYTIAADGTNVVQLTRTFATEADWDTASSATHEGGDAPTYDAALVSDSRA